VPSIFLVTVFSFDDDTKPRVHQAYLADLDGDGHLDAFLIYFNELNRVLLNDGQGGFSDTGQRLGRGLTRLRSASG
jgi:hypothetical protein